VRATGGFTLTGALLAAHAAPDLALDLTGATLKFAPCVVAFRLRKSTLPNRVRERAWSEIF
jgi:hypothetical protein